jgi:tetratricopeptide (TPR) repeat protein
MTDERGSSAALDAALQDLVNLLPAQPALAAERAAVLLRASPDQPVATHYLGVALGRLGHRKEALATLRRAVRLKPDLAEAWRSLADLLLESGDPSGADAAYANHLVAAMSDGRLPDAVAALCGNRLADADALLRTHLAQQPDDAAALRLLAEVALRVRRYPDAETLLRRCLELAPGSLSARHALAVVLHELGRPGEALAEIERLLEAEPSHPDFLNLQANALARSGDYGRAVAAYETLLAGYPDSARIWTAYGDALKSAGRFTDGITAYRRAIELAPGFGEAWWSLSNLKTFRFDAAEVASMESLLADKRLSPEDRLYLDFALGKALEDAARYAESFAHYAEGNRIRRTAISYDAATTADHVRRCKALFTGDFLRPRRAWGSPDPDPIFIVGLPRSGSTLVEQILASHSTIEGTMELHDVIGLARGLARHAGESGPMPYPEVLAELGADEFRELGERYLRQTRVQRRRAAPLFIDKMPNNWLHVGLIHLMLPHAKIVDVRRHPMGCCFSCFRQHFARGQAYAYSLQDLGRYYRDYVDLMAHFDAVLPGRVHRVIYERLVDDTEGEVRRLLAYCGLPYEEACLRFHETSRAVSTPSSEQVRLPIFREALDQWRHYEPWLGPLREALGPVVDAYPDPPARDVSSISGS